MRRIVTAGLVALLVVTAGCVGGIGGTPTADGAGDGSAGGDGTATSGSGTVNFYVSDQPNDMDDFEHLNVTVTTVRFHLVEEDESATDGTANGTATAAPNGTVTATATATETSNATATPTGTDSPAETETPNATATPTITAVEDGTEEAEPDEDEREEEDEEERDEEEAESDDDEGEDGRWVTREVNTTTVDLTRLRGANATLVEQFDLPAGEYDQVRLEVSETEGVLKDGRTTEVKLPSERLKLNQEFTVGDGEEVDFVYDITVHRAGNSGKYILRPVASESGTEVPIERVDGDERLDVRFVGSVAPGENATVRVTDAGEGVANATVSVEGIGEGTTDADGEYAFAVPADAEEIEVEATAGDAEGELEREFEDAEEDGDGEGDGDGESDGDGEAGGSGNGNGPSN